MDAIELLITQNYLSVSAGVRSNLQGQIKKANVEYNVKLKKGLEKGLAWGIAAEELSHRIWNDKELRKAVLQGMKEVRKIGKEDQNVLSSGSFCANEKSARLYFDFRVANGGECLANYSTIGLQNMQQTCRSQQAEQLERNTIYNKRFIEKSKGATRTATPSIRAVCRQISENPTMLQRWR